MRRNTIETILGAVVLVGAGLFMALAYDAANLTPSDGYELKAEFGTISGLTVGDDVRLSGIKIGQITEQSLDPTSYMAVVVMRINPEIQLPSDTSARITSSSLLGGNFLEFIPGADLEYLGAGDVIYDTRDPVSLTDLLGQAVFRGGSSSTKSGDEK